MKVYLDTCSLQRPLDAKNQLRILLESEAVLALIALCDTAQIELVPSEALLFETARAVDVTRKEFALEVLQKAAHFIQVEPTFKPERTLSTAKASALWTRYIWRWLKRRRQIIFAPVTTNF